MLHLEGITKSYGNRKVLTDVTHTFAAGELTVIRGASGVGKTTLLHLIGGLEQPDAGVRLFNQQQLTPSAYRRLRREQFGYIFQNFGLLDNETVAYNIQLAQKRQKRSTAQQEIVEALQRVGLEGLNPRQKSHTLSGGEQQRVAIARVLYKNPFIVLADEPTAHLDCVQATIIWQQLRALCDQGQMVIAVSHDPEVLHIADVVLTLDFSGLARERMEMNE